MTLTDPLASLQHRTGWKHTAAGWLNKKLDITVTTNPAGRFLIIHDGHTRELTSATGVLCWLDQHTTAIAAKAVTE